MRITSPQFRCVPHPSDDVINRLAVMAPQNPFCTVGYAKVRKRLGSQPYCILVETAGTIVTGCLAFLTRGKLNSRLEITSLPPIPANSEFWSGVFGFCRDQGVSVLSVQTFGSTEADIPVHRGILFSKRRVEFRLDLKRPDLWRLMNRRTQRLVKKARSASIEMRLASDSESFATHQRFANSSLDRRRGKGESVNSSIRESEIAAFVDCGLGRIFQAVSGGNVLSSLLVVAARSGCYAQSSGTSDEGRSLGASHFLFHEAALYLKNEGLELFNVGGADAESTGLQNFKNGLGAEPVELRSAEYFVGNAIKRFVSRTAAFLRR